MLIFGMRYKICPMQESEIYKVMRLHNKYLGKKDFINKKEISRRLKLNKGIFLVAKDDSGSIVGIKLGYIENNICIGRGIAVDKKFREQGIGRELIEVFEDKLRNFPYLKKYIFASSTEEGVPFHIRLGYKPSILLQSKDKEFLEEIHIKNFTIKRNSYNKSYKVHQACLESSKELDLDYLSKIKLKYPQVDIQYLFEKNL